MLESIVVVQPLRLVVEGEGELRAAPYSFFILFHIINYFQKC